MSVNPSQILARTAEIIEERGWIQGRNQTPNGVCMLQAFRYAEIELCGKVVSAEGNTAHTMIYDHLGMPLHRWNDQGKRTQDEVVTVLLDLAS